MNNHTMQLAKRNVARQMRANAVSNVFAQGLAQSEKTSILAQPAQLMEPPTGDTPELHSIAIKGDRKGGST